MALSFSAAQKRYKEINLNLSKSKSGGYVVKAGRSRLAELNNLKDVEQWLKDNKQGNSQATNGAASAISDSEQGKEDVKPESVPAAVEVVPSASTSKEQSLAIANSSKITNTAFDAYFLPDKTNDDATFQDWATLPSVPILQVVEHLKLDPAISKDQLAYELAVRGVSSFFSDEQGDSIVVGTDKSFVWDAI